MDNFVGENVKDITLKKQSDVIVKKVLTTNALVNLAKNTETLEPGSVLVTNDNGLSFEIAKATDKANAILCEALNKSSQAEVLLIGVVRQKYLVGLDVSHKGHLFTNKIILI